MELHPQSSVRSYKLRDCMVNKSIAKPFYNENQYSTINTSLIYIRGPTVPGSYDKASCREFGVHCSVCMEDVNERQAAVDLLNGKVKLSPTDLYGILLEERLTGNVVAFL